MLTQERLKQALKYDPETGVFTWAESGRGRKIGRQAGGLTHEGYLRITVDQQEYKAHRLAWLYVHGEWPKQVIDHINRDRSDNRIANLRDVSSMENSNNHGGYSTNSSGHTGVCWNKNEGKWQAYLGRKYLGLYAAISDAVSARKMAEAG